MPILYLDNQRYSLAYLQYTVCYVSVVKPATPTWLPSTCSVLLGLFASLKLKRSKKDSIRKIPAWDRKQGKSKPLRRYAAGSQVRHSSKVQESRRQQALLPLVAPADDNPSFASSLAIVWLVIDRGRCLLLLDSYLCFLDLTGTRSRCIKGGCLMKLNRRRTSCTAQLIRPSALCCMKKKMQGEILFKNEVKKIHSLFRIDMLQTCYTREHISAC